MTDRWQVYVHVGHSSALPKDHAHQMLNLAQVVEVRQLLGASGGFKLVQPLRLRLGTLEVKRENPLLQGRLPCDLVEAVVPANAPKEDLDRVESAHSLIKAAVLVRELDR